jgi:anti-anti-sigma regulatory factor
MATLTAESDPKELFAEIQRLEYDMGERMKELTCMYMISDLMMDEETTEEVLFQGIADILAPSWQYPEIGCGRVTALGVDYESKNFAESEWCQYADVYVEDEPVGRVEIYYSEERPDMGADEGPFMQEERHLINVIGERVAEYIRRGMMAEATDQIRSQSQAMTDLSTPVITIWQDIVLMPLIGVIDTSRAQQIIERLLETIVESEALVAILDVTGVPVIDTSVARNILKTVEAAKMLGADVVVTGFSAGAAQTLAQLGVDFSDMRTRGSLRAGFGEAIEIIGQQIVDIS